jgi:hypothetical protein
MLTRPSPPAILGKMLIRVIALAFYLCVLNYCSPCTKAFFTIRYASKEEDFSSTLSSVVTVTYFKNKGPSIFYRLCWDGEEGGMDINEFRLTRLNILLCLTLTCLIFVLCTSALTNSFSKTCAICAGLVAQLAGLVAQSVKRATHLPEQPGGRGFKPWLRSLLN